MSNLNISHELFISTRIPVNVCQLNHISCIRMQVGNRTRFVMGCSQIIVLDIGPVCSNSHIAPFFNVWIDKYDHYARNERWPDAIESLRTWNMGNGFIHYSVRNLTDRILIEEVVLLALGVHHG